MGAFAFEGSHKANTMIAENPVVMIMTLNRPMRSATIPGRIRPKILGTPSASLPSGPINSTYEAAFKIGIIYIDKFADIPWLRALRKVSYIHKIKGLILTE